MASLFTGLILGVGLGLAWASRLAEQRQADDLAFIADRFSRFNLESTITYRKDDSHA